MVWILSIRSDFLVLLILFYFLFVLGDVLTTFWLIRYYPGGITGEMNPFAHLIFMRYGYLGMFLSKAIVFLVSSTVFIILYNMYSRLSWFREALEIMILGLSGLSSIVIVNNIFSIIVVSRFIYGSQPTWLLKTLIFILSMCIVGIGSLTIFRNPVYITESIVGCIISLAPLISWPNINPVLYTAYIILLFIIIILSTYYLKIFNII